MSKSIVAIVGRPNVGKSTLFNRLTQTRQAIVDEYSGVTRDRHYGEVFWGNKSFTLIDTGGYTPSASDVFEDEIRKQVILAIEEANVILFVVDVTCGVTDFDQTVAALLRKTKKPVFLVVNKVDNHQRSNEMHEFYALGIADQLYGISSVSGSGTGDLLDDLLPHIEASKEELSEEELNTKRLPKIAIIGRPNVGKSSLLNTLVGEQRNIVTDIAGTTRDAISTHYNAFGFDFELIDTAGIRRKTKVEEDLEFYSVMRSLRTLESCDVCLLMIEAHEGLMAQDMALFQLAIKNGKGIVLLVNKWDLFEKETDTIKKYEEGLRKRMAPFNDVPIVFTSVINKQRIHKALEEAMRVVENRNRRIPTHKLNEIMGEVIASYPPPAYKGKYVKIKFITQLPTQVPSFAFFCNLPQYVKDPYKRYLENNLREKFDFKGVPINIFMRKK